MIGAGTAPQQACSESVEPLEALHAVVDVLSLLRLIVAGDEQVSEACMTEPHSQYSPAVPE